MGIGDLLRGDDRVGRTPSLRDAHGKQRASKPCRAAASRSPESGGPRDAARQQNAPREIPAKLQQPPRAKAACAQAQLQPRLQPCPTEREVLSRQGKPAAV
eukprot:10310759-Heterocapsa_arctica.AAC.1